MIQKERNETSRSKSRGIACKRNHNFMKLWDWIVYTITRKLFTNL